MKSGARIRRRLLVLGQCDGLVVATTAAKAAAARLPGKSSYYRSAIGLSSRRLFASSGSKASGMTPEEAGRRAKEMAQQNKNKLDDKKQQQQQVDTVLAHAGIGATTGRISSNMELSPSLHLATTYERPADGPYHEDDSIYTRLDNPTRVLLEREVARLETHGAQEAADVADDDDDDNSPPTAISCAFASGMMAASGLILAHRTPLTVVLPLDLYHGVPTVLQDVFSRFNVVVHRVDVRDRDALAKVLLNEDNDVLPPENEAIVWLESPSNPQCHVIDILATCDLVRRVRPSNTSVVVDSTLAPPTLTQPLRLGADFCLHSCTKFMGGHSDALLGVVTASPWTDRGRALGPVLQATQIAVGGVASAFDSWLTLRGLRTLAVRVQKQSATAMALATFLHQHPSVHKVHYPGLDKTAEHDGADIQYEIAQRQMKGGLFGGVLSVEMDSESKAMALAGALRTIQRATSLGGTETLIEHRASIEPAGRVVSLVGLLRIAVGLEDANDLIADLESALAICDELHAA